MPQCGQLTGCGFATPTSSPGPTRAWSAFDGTTPDKRPVFGKNGTEGLYVCVGAGYKGFKVAPAVGRQMAELKKNGRTPVDSTALRQCRFGQSPRPTGLQPYSLPDEF